MKRKDKYRHTKSLLPFYRRDYFLVVSTCILFLFGLLVLPDANSEKIHFLQLRLTFFSVLILAWAANILSDNLKPIWLHIIVTFSAIAVFLWMVFAYIGIGVSDLHHIFFNFSVMKGQWHLMLEGFITTMELALISAVLATMIGLIVGVMRLLNNKTLDIFLKIYLEFFRIMPILVILIIVYFGLPFLNITIGPFASGVLVLSLTNGAYISEIFRSGIASIHKTQYEASHVLGMSFPQTMRLVLVPQAFRIVFPPLTNRWIGILKDTAVCSFIAIRELLKCSQIITTQRANPTPLVIATTIYLGILIPLTIITTYLERRYKHTNK